MIFSYRINIEESREYWRLIDNQITSVQNASSANIINKEDLWSQEIYIYVYTILVLSIFVVGIARSISFFTICVRSSQRLHNMVFKALIQTSMRFFDTNPSGRILNRFSKDMGGIDELLPKAILDAGQVILQMVGVIVVTCIVNWLFLIPIGFLSILFWFIRKIYLKTSKNIKRLEGISEYGILVGKFSLL